MPQNRKLIYLPEAERDFREIVSFFSEGTRCSIRKKCLYYNAGHYTQTTRLPFAWSGSS